MTNGPLALYKTDGLLNEKAKLRLIFAHGWGQSHHAFDGLLDSFRHQTHIVLLDFPGFGGAPLPPNAWGTADYARDVATLLRTHPFDGKTIWICHSFGARVGLQLIASDQTLVDGLFVIAGAGLPRRRGLPQKLYRGTRVQLFKLLKRIYQSLGLNSESLKNRFGSADYKNAGPLRETFMRVVTEDLSLTATKVSCPTYLLYGEKDDEAPPDIGERYHTLIPQSELVVLKGEDHYSLLTDGRHQTIKHLDKFIRRYAS